MEWVKLGFLSVWLVSTQLFLIYKKQMWLQVPAYL